ncbi:MAG: DNA-binding protein [Pseudorhodobacter sp. PARRP1]|nr:MAG: DNA-binding protein [Pseudorhodobacter sp. PARRP1]
MLSTKTQPTADQKQIATPHSSDPLLIAREAAAILQVSVPTFWRRVADGTVPKPVKLGGLSRWPQTEILAVIETAKAARTVA